MVTTRVRRPLITIRNRSSLTSTHSGISAYSSSLIQAGLTGLAHWTT